MSDIWLNNAFCCKNLIRIKFKIVPRRSLAKRDPHVNHHLQTLRQYTKRANAYSVHLLEVLYTLHRITRIPRTIYIYIYTQIHINRTNPDNGLIPDPSIYNISSFFAYQRFVYCANIP